MTETADTRVNPRDPEYRLRALTENAVGRVLVEADHWMSLELRNRVAVAALEVVRAELANQAATTIPTTAGSELPRAGDGRWQDESVRYEVVLGHPLWTVPTVYAECGTLGAAARDRDRALVEVEAYELEGPVFTRRITTQFREERA